MKLNDEVTHYYTKENAQDHYTLWIGSIEFYETRIKDLEKDINRFKDRITEAERQIKIIKSVDSEVS